MDLRDFTQLKFLSVDIEWLIGTLPEQGTDASLCWKWIPPNIEVLAVESWSRVIQRCPASVCRTYFSSVGRALRALLEHKEVLAPHLSEIEIWCHFKDSDVDDDRKLDEEAQRCGVFVNWDTDCYESRYPCVESL